MSIKKIFVSCIVFSNQNKIWFWGLQGGHNLLKEMSKIKNMLIKHVLEIQDTIRTSSTTLVLNDGNEKKWFFNQKCFKW